MAAAADIRRLSSPRSAALLAGIICLALLVIANHGLRRWYVIPIVSPHLQFALLFVGLTLCAWGLIGQSSRLVWTKPSRTTWALLGIMLLALLLRLWRVDAEIRMFLDELPVAVPIAHLLDGKPANLFWPSDHVSGLPWLAAYLKMPFVALFGRDFFGLRLMSVLAGMLTIPALYMLASALFDKRTALLAALLLATFPPHLHFSRIAIDSVLGTMPAIFALAFLARGLRHNRRADWVLGGLFLGLNLYIYEAARLLFPVLTLVWLGGYTLLNRQPLRPFLRQTSPALVAFFLAAAPLVITWLALGMPLTNRLGRQSEEGGVWLSYLLSPSNSAAFSEFINRIIAPFLVYTTLPDTGFYYNGGPHALILSWLTPAFLVGLLVLLLRPRSSGALLLLPWLLLTSLGNILLRDNAWTARYAVTFAALPLLIAVGLVTLADQLRKITGAGHPARHVFAAAAALFIAAAQAGYYFDQHLPTFTHNIHRFANTHDVYARARNLPPDTQLHLAGYVILYEVDVTGLNYFYQLDYEPHIWFDQDFTPEALAALPRDVNHAFFIDSSRPELVNILRSQFTIDPPQFTPYQVPPERAYVLYLARKAAS